MKKNKLITLSIITVFLASIFIISCSKDDASTSSQETKEISEINYDSLEEELSKMLLKTGNKNSRNEKIEYVSFDVTIIDNNFKVKDIIYLSKDVYEFGLGFSGDKNPFQRLTSKGTISVGCSGGTNDGVSKSCPDKFGQKVCVGNAVVDCINGGGCAEVCYATVTMKL